MEEIKVQKFKFAIAYFIPYYFAIWALVFTIYILFYFGLSWIVTYSPSIPVHELQRTFFTNQGFIYTFIIAFGLSAILMWRFVAGLSITITDTWIKQQHGFNANYIPLSKISTVTIYQGPIQKIMRLYSLNIRINSANGTYALVRIDSLSKEDAERMKTLITSKHSRIPSPSPSVFSINRSWILDSMFYHFLTVILVNPLLYINIGIYIGLSPYLTSMYLHLFFFILPLLFLFFFILGVNSSYKITKCKVHINQSQVILDGYLRKKALEIPNNSLFYVGIYATFMSSLTNNYYVWMVDDTIDNRFYRYPQFPTRVYRGFPWLDFTQLGRTIAPHTIVIPGQSKENAQKLAETIASSIQ